MEWKSGFEKGTGERESKGVKRRRGRGVKDGWEERRGIAIRLLPSPGLPACLPVFLVLLHARARKAPLDLPTSYCVGVAVAVARSSAPPTLARPSAPPSVMAQNGKNCCLEGPQQRLLPPSLPSPYRSFVRPFAYPIPPSPLFDRARELTSKENRTDRVTGYAEQNGRNGHHAHLGFGIHRALCSPIVNEAS